MKALREKDDKIPTASTSTSASRPARPAYSPGVGNALRKAYRDALDEDIPSEMLDLLGKLG